MGSVGEPVKLQRLRLRAVPNKSIFVGNQFFKLYVATIFLPFVKLQISAKIERKNNYTKKKFKTVFSNLSFFWHCFSVHWGWVSPPPPPLAWYWEGRKLKLMVPLVVVAMFSILFTICCSSLRRSQSASCVNWFSLGNLVFRKQHIQNQMNTGVKKGK